MPSSEPWHRYVAVSGRLVHYVVAGRGPVIVLQHASPGDWRSLAWLVAALAEDYCVLALDTPGHGLSDPLAVEQPEITHYGSALLDTLTTLGLERVHLYGNHTGAKIALDAATTAPARVASLTLDGVGVSTPAERADQLAHYTPTWELQPDGSHLVRAWHQVRNMFLFWPWYAERPDHLLRDAMPPVEELHDIAHGMIRAGDRYRLAYRAAFRHDPSQDLSRVQVPTRIAAAADDPLQRHLARIGSLPDGVRMETVSDDRAARARWVAAELAQGTDAGTATDEALTAAAASPCRRFVPTDLGDVHVTMDGHGVDTLTIAPVGDSQDAAAASRTMTVELPGTGRSSLAEGASLDRDTLAECLREVCAACGVRPGLVETRGVGGSVARVLARSLGAEVRTAGSVLDVPPDDLPDLIPHPDGGHLLAAWHLVRDGALRHLAAAGTWPGRTGELDLARTQYLVVSLTGRWRTFPQVYRACWQADREHA